MRCQTECIFNHDIELFSWPQWGVKCYLNMKRLEEMGREQETV